MFLTGVLSVKDSSGNIIGATDASGNSRPVSLRLGSGLTSAVVDNGASADVQITATGGSGGSGNVTVARDGVVIGARPTLDFRGSLKPMIVDYPAGNSLILSFEPGFVRYTSTLWSPAEIEFAGAGVTVETKSGGVLVTIPRTVVQDEATSVTTRPTVNYAGQGVTVTDNAVHDRTDVTIPGVRFKYNNGILDSRQYVNFTGDGVVVTDDAVNDITHVAITSSIICDAVLETDVVPYAGVDVGSVMADGRTIEEGMKLLLVRESSQEYNGPYLVGTPVDDIAPLTPLWSGTIPAYTQIRISGGTSWLDSLWSTHATGTFQTDNLMIVPVEYTISNVPLVAGTVQIENVFAFANASQAYATCVLPDDAEGADFTLATRTWVVTEIDNVYTQLYRAHVVVEALTGSGTRNTSDTSHVDVRIVNRRGVVSLS